MKHYLVLVFLPCLLASFVNAYALPSVIDNSIYPGSTTPANAVIPGTPSINTMMDLMAKIDQLQSDVQQLTGKVEEQSHQINELKKQQKAYSGDFDERISTLENKTLGSDPAEATAEATAVTEQGPASSEGTNTADAASSENASEAAGQEVAEKPAAQAAAVPQAENEQYQQSLDLLRHGRTDESIAGFKAFLTQYPDSELANNAQYWLGEAYRAKHDDVSAMKAFNEVITHYPNGIKVPDALLKLGYMAVEQNQMDQAREYLNRVINHYPNTRPALLAERKLASLNGN